MEQILQLARALRLSQGELLALARELAQEGALISIQHLTAGQRFQLQVELTCMVLKLDLDIAA